MLHVKNDSCPSLVTFNVISGTSPTSLKEAKHRSLSLPRAHPSLRIFGFVTMRLGRGNRVPRFGFGTQEKRAYLGLKHESQVPAHLFRLCLGAWGVYVRLHGRSSCSPMPSCSCVWSSLKDLPGKAESRRDPGFLVTLMSAKCLPLPMTFTWAKV